MDNFQKLVDATARDYQQHVLGNPLIEDIGSGRVSREQYVVYLRETFHLVRHTSRALARAASRLGDERRALRAWFLEQARDEHGHEQMCLSDLRALGADADAIVAALPGCGAWGVVTENYFYASEGNPAALLGVASATEGMGAELAGGIAATLNRRYGIPTQATTFLRSHSGFDQRHYADVRRAIDVLTQPEDFCWIVHARRMTLRNFGQLLLEVASLAQPRWQTRHG